MWFPPVESLLIPPRSLPGEAGFTPRTLTRPEQTTTSQDPGSRRAVSAAQQSQNQPSAPSETPRSPRLRVSPDAPRLRVSEEGCPRDREADVWRQRPPTSSRERT